MINGGRARRRLKPAETEERRAEFSLCGKFRYTLMIRWGAGGRLVQFIGLNPSTADEKFDDPTVRRCKEFARRWGFDGILMTNLFAFRATDPADMMKEENPVGEIVPGEFQIMRTQNDFALVSGCAKFNVVQIVACWGNDGLHMNRAQHVLQYMTHMKCFGPKLTKLNQPKHPLYLANETQLIDYVAN